MPREACKGAIIPPCPVWGCGGGDSLVDLFVCGCEQEQPQGTLILPERLHECAFGAGAAGLRSWASDQVVTSDLGERPQSILGFALSALVRDPGSTN